MERKQITRLQDSKFLSKSDENLDFYDDQTNIF